MPPRTLIVDSNARMRRTIRQVIEDSTDLQVCGEGTDGQDAIRKAEQLETRSGYSRSHNAEDEWIASGASHQEAAAQGAPGFVQPGRKSACGQCGESCRD